jgi:2-polyprenyl-3-methyl-5-hydroxy-6-metoxy-1,4-benzoquinol methylase
MANLWDERYSARDYAFGKKPNMFFESVIRPLKRGSLLVPGAGEGRDAVFAATLGWKVDAFDLSLAGRNKCAALAREFKTAVNYTIMDAAAFKAGAGKYDAVALIYFHLPPAVRQPFHRKVAQSLKKGGVIIMEAFNPLQINNKSGGPKDLGMLYTPAMIEDDFAGMEIKQNEEAETTLHEGKYHEGKANVLRFVGIKK